MIFMQFFFLSDFLCKDICCGYSFELHHQVDAIQMSTHKICLYKEVDKKYTAYNLKTTELLDSALIGICAVIRSNTVIRAHFKESSAKVIFNDAFAICFIKSYVVGTHLSRGNSNKYPQYMIL